MSNETDGISIRIFIAGIIITILVSSGFSVVINTQLDEGSTVVGGLGTPDYDSEWQPIAQDSFPRFDHDLGTTEVFVYMIGRSAAGINQAYYGGVTAYDGRRGAYWTHLDENSIYIARENFDPAWPEVRVMIWKLPPST